MTERDRRRIEARGRAAERLAALWLRGKLYRILGRRVRTHVGEIDLVARSARGVVCFIEIKARADENTAAEAIAARQRMRIARAASVFLAAHPKMRADEIRFDAILMVPGRWPRHLKDAWRP